MTPFYITEIEETKGFLTDEEARHCVKVLRLKRGDEVLGVDGKGNMHRGLIRDLKKNSVEIAISETIPEWGEHEYNIALWVSPLHKADRFEWLVEKAVELGVNQIRPFVSQRTVKPSFREERIRRIAISAMKQCMRSRLPEINQPVDISEAVTSAAGQPGLFGYMEASAPVTDFAEKIRSEGVWNLFIGPEGGFTPEEAAQLMEAGAHPISLGASRLRTETAAIHLLSGIKLLKGY